MTVIEDIGEVLPFAKKHMFNQSNKANTENNNTSSYSNEVNVTLKSLWPEPDWKNLYANGYPKNLLAAIYSHYHSLRSKPKDDETFSQNGVKITPDMWKEAYIESIYFIKEWCENTISLEGLKNISKAFNEHFGITKSSKITYQQYAAGKNTGKTLFHALKAGGKFNEYKRLLPLLDWPNSVEAKKIKLFPMEFTKKSSPDVFYMLCDVNLKSLSWQTDAKEHPTYESAVNELLEKHADSFTVKSSGNTSELYIPRKKIRDLINAPDEFNNITAHSLMSHFGFRGIQFGNALSNKERQLFVSNTYHAFQVICSILNIPPKWVGFGGLGLAFGARGFGSAAAHYEPRLNIINLTRFNGAGSIAHEFFHSIDSRLAKKCGFADELYSELPYKTGNESIQKRLNAFNAIIAACTDRSKNYYKCAKQLEEQKGGGNYWASNCELLARAFEAYIQDTIENEGLGSEWASIGTKESDYKKEMHPYPTGQERLQLNRMFMYELRIVFES